MPKSRDSNRLTLLVLASTYPRWIADTEPGFVHELAKRLVDQFHVIALVPGAPGAAARETLDGVEVIRYRYAPRRFETLVNDGGIITNLRRYRWKMLLIPTFLLAQAWHTWRLLRTRHIDVVHAHWLLPQGLIACLIGKLLNGSKPYLVTSHGADLFALRGKCFNAFKRFVVGKAEAITVVSQTMRSELAHIGANISRVSVQPMGVDLRGLFLPDSKALRSRNEILFVGRLVEKKGLRYLIDAMPAILHANPAAYLTIAGFGPDKAALVEQAQRLGLQSKVQFVGAVAQRDLPSLYRRAAIFVAPFVQAISGDREGLGLVAVEAAGCDCPVVVSDLPAVRDVFDATQATLVAPGSASAISEAVVALFAAVPSADMAARVRASLCARFDWNIVAQNYARILRGITDTPLGSD